MPAKEGERQQGISEDDLQGVDAERYYEIRKQFYRDRGIAEKYDEHRISGARSSRHRAEWRAIERALARAGWPAAPAPRAFAGGSIVEALEIAALGLGAPRAALGHEVLRNAGGRCEIRAWLRPDVLVRFAGADREPPDDETSPDAAQRAELHRAARDFGVRDLLDVPTGTGRFVDALLRRGVRVTGADISREMMVQRSGALTEAGALGFVQCEAEALPFRDASFDMVASIRFFMHLTPRVRLAVLRELARVSRRWVLVDYRHRHAPRNALKRWAHALGLRRTPAPPRVSREEMLAELAASGLREVETFVVTPVFSDKWFVLCEKAS